MSSTFTPALIGQTEKALNAILAGELAGTGVTEPQWVTLSLLAMGGGALPRAELAARAAGALQVATAGQERIDELIAAGLLAQGDDAQQSLTITAAGQQLYGRVRAAVVEITGRMWGDLPAEDLAAAGRLLSIILERANAELARG